MDKRKNHWNWILFGIQFFLCTIFVFLPTISFSQITFERTYVDNSSEGRSVQQTSDGGYIIGGVRGANDFLLMKTDSLGDTLWTKTHGGSNTEFAYSLDQTSDQGFIMTGYTYSFGAGESDVYLVRTDSLGDTLWTKYFGGTAFDEGFCVRRTTDGGYIIAGYTDSFGMGGGDVYLIKTDSLGDSLWTKTFGGSLNDFGVSVEQTSDLGYMVTGYTKSFGSGDFDLYLIKTDTSGDTLWTKTYGGASSEIGFSGISTGDGGYIFIGSTNSFGAGAEDVYIVKADSLGDTLWTKTYGGTDSEEGHSIQQTSDGGYIITGYTVSYGLGWTDVYLIRTDSLGDSLWTRTYGYDRIDNSYSVQQTLDSGFIITGIRNVPSGAPLLLIKTDGNGEVKGDGGVILIEFPPDTVLGGTSQNVRAIAKNFGNSYISCDVIATVDVYADTYQLKDLLSDMTKQIFFQNWNVPLTDSTIYTMSVCTEVYLEEDTTNDCMIKNIFAYQIVHDGGVLSIDSPIEDTVFTDSTYPVTATIHNFGNVVGLYDVYVTIDGYADSIIVSSVAPGADTQLTFTPWTVPSPDSMNYLMEVWTFHPLDADPTNDRLQKNIFAYSVIHDGGVYSLESPGATVFTDSTYDVIASVKNFGSVPESLEVVVSIDGYIDIIKINNLAPGVDTQLTFTPWTVPSVDSTNYVFNLCTFVSGDGDSTNDCVLKAIYAFTIIHDGGVVSIDDPSRDTLFADSTYSVSATIKNFGSLTDTFEVVTTIDGYSDTLSLVVLAPSTDTLLSFSPWTVPSVDSATYIMNVCNFVAGDSDSTNDCAGMIFFAHESQGPILLSACASDNVNLFPGIDDDDQVIIDFDEPTNRPNIDASNINSVLSLSNGHTWLDISGNISDAAWNSAGDSLTITLSTNGGLPTVSVGDTITTDGITIQDIWGNPAVSVITITCSFGEVGIGEQGVFELPTVYSLSHNQPNPFHHSTVIRYQIPSTNHVRLAIYDIAGRIVETLMDEHQEQGVYQVQLDSASLSSGIYFYRLQTDDYIDTKKLILLR
jgi:hypothetical protein